MMVLADGCYGYVYVVNMSMKSGICDCGSNGRRDGLIWDDVKLRCKGKGTF